MSSNPELVRSCARQNYDELQTICGFMMLKFAKKILQTADFKSNAAFSTDFGAFQNTLLLTAIGLLQGLCL